MAIITLTTDWGVNDYYVPALKGQLMSLCPGATIVDISHEVPHFDILQASYILSNCFYNFPEGTIHFIAMRGGKRKINAEGEESYLLVKCRGHYFIGYDSGIFYLTLEDAEKEIYKLDISPEQPIYIASCQLCNIIATLITGASAETLGTRINEIQKVYNAQPTSDKSSIRGNVIHIDTFSNIVSNINKDLFEKVGNNRSFILSVRNYNHPLKNHHTNYDEKDEGELVILFNERGNLVIALNRAPASSLMGLKLFDPIRIEFDEVG